MLTSEATRTSIIALNMVQLTTEKRTFVVIKTFTKQKPCSMQARVAFGLINLEFQFPTVEECDFDKYVAISSVSLRFKKGTIKKLNNSSFVRCKN
jgi:hypothetical protein